MDIKTVKTTPYNDQKPRTSGLRKSTSHFQKPHYLQNFIQSIFDVLKRCNPDYNSLTLGGDGRFFNPQAIQITIKMAIANHFKHLFIGQHGYLSTPAASHIIRKNRTDFGIILSASHNPGGPDGDFGIKLNQENGSPAIETLTEEIFLYSQSIREYRIAEIPDIDLHKIRTHQAGETTISVIDPVADYSVLMQSLFDFDLIHSRIQSSQLSFCFDAMHAITGPYAQRIFCGQLGAPSDWLMNCEPQSDFAGTHPDPNPENTRTLTRIMMSDDAPDLGAASDGDGDRNMILGKNIFVTPSDSLAVMTANTYHIPGYRDKCLGVARSMPTSQAVSRVTNQLGIPHYETPTGWKFFGNLLDTHAITFCGEESFGTGSSHVREKDGLWAVLYWLNLLAIKKQPVQTILKDHWQTYGRNYYSRHDYEHIKHHVADSIISNISTRLDDLPGTVINGYRIVSADNFSYTDPVDHSESHNQGLRICLSDDARIVFRLSGTDTQGATLRIYLECYEPDPEKHGEDVQQKLTPLIDIAEIISEVMRTTKRTRPTTIT